MHRGCRSSCLPCAVCSGRGRATVSGGEPEGVVAMARKSNRKPVPRDHGASATSSTRRNVIVELRHSPDVAPQASTRPGSRLDLRTVPKLAGVDFDSGYAPVRLTRRSSQVQRRHLSSTTADDAKHSTYVVRAEVDERVLDALREHPDVVGVFSDPGLRRLATCWDTPPVGDDGTVENLLNVSHLHACGMDGSGVLVAVVDGGVNIDYLKQRGKTPTFLPDLSWASSDNDTPGSMPVGHGTMCAFAVCIAAPKCTLLDYVLGPMPDTMEGFTAARLSDGQKAFSRLLEIMQAPLRLGQFRSIVVTS